MRGRALTEWNSSNFRNYISVLISLVLIASVISCDEPQSAYSPQYGAVPAQEKNSYVIGVHPLHNPQRLHEIFGPLASFLTNAIEGAVFRIEASRNYAAFDEKLYAEKFDFALPNPYQTVQSLHHNYTVFGKMGDDENFRGIILIRKDSQIDDAMDLIGKTVCFPAETALAATMMPQYYLQTHGIDVNRDIAINYVGSQESSIMNVFLGNAAAGGTWPPPWRALTKERPQLLEEVEVKWQTEPLPNNGLVVRSDVPSHITSQVAAILFNLHTTEEGKSILERMELSKFEPASNETYRPVEDFLDKFNSGVRHIAH
jgi:phosphonate transport system substrate-binding protein